MTPEVDKAERLRALHHGPPVLVLANAWDAASARIVESEGFPAVATTSAGVAAALGYADGGDVPAREMIEAVARIARAVSVPVSADIEHGYASTPDAVADVVMRVVAAGAVGVNLEDILPGSDALEPIDVQCDKIRAITKSASTSGVGVVINARTDVYLRAIGPAESRLDAAVARGRAYLAAGAGCVFVPGVKDRATIAALVKGIGGPINVLAMPDSPPIAELEALGVARVSLGSGPFRASLAILRDVARELKSTGTYSFIGKSLPYATVNDLMK